MREAKDLGSHFKRLSLHFSNCAKKGPKIMEKMEKEVVSKKKKVMFPPMIRAFVGVYLCFFVANELEPIAAGGHSAKPQSHSPIVFDAYAKKNGQTSFEYCVQRFQT